MSVWAFVRRTHSASIAAAALVLTLVAACGGDDEAPVEPLAVDLCLDPSLVRLSLGAEGATPLDLTQSPFDEEFAAAGTEFDVPSAVLKSVAWVETRWQMVEGAEEFDGVPAAFGVMALRGKRLEGGAALAGATVEAARSEPLANIRSAAALLDAYASEVGIDRSRPEEWAAVVVRFSGIEIEAGRSAYAQQVGRALTRGIHQQAVLRGDTWGIRLPHLCTEPWVPPPPPPPPPPPTDTVDYEPAVWRPSPNFNTRVGETHFVIIHTCEGSYTGCWSWLVNPVSVVSSHYVIDEEGTEISQLVRERDRAWHIAATYDCTRDLGQDCHLNGIQSNHITIGIEHAGFASQSSFPATQIEASAALVCDITRDNDVPRDWQHIVGHGQLQPWNRTDPGPNWPWVGYLHSIQRHCGEVVVDDENGRNDATVAATTIDAPSEWTASSLTADYYGDGYRYAATRDDAEDGVTFSFLVEAPESLAIDARWTSGSNRSPRAQYLVIDAGGDTLADLRLDQTGGGGEWHSLGTWTFSAGWSRVVLLHRDTPGFVVIADAVRARR